MAPAYRNQVLRLTERYGGEWALRHAERLVRLVALIAEERDYDSEAIWLAAYLHDWGTLPHFQQEPSLHCRRSKQLAEGYLLKWEVPHATVERALEAIEFHHGGTEDRCVEAVLLCDADALEGLGVMGVLREFAQIPTEPSDCYEIPTSPGMAGARQRVLLRMANNPNLLRLPKSRYLARQRLRDMKRLLAAFDRDSFGCL